MNLEDGAARTALNLTNHLLMRWFVFRVDRQAKAVHFFFFLNFSLRSRARVSLSLNYANLRQEEAAYCIVTKKHRTNKDITAYNPWKMVDK